MSNIKDIHEIIFFLFEIFYLYTFFGSKSNNQYNNCIIFPNIQVEINGSIANIKPKNNLIFKLIVEG